MSNSKDNLKQVPISFNKTEPLTEGKTLSSENGEGVQSSRRAKHLKGSHSSPSVDSSCTWRGSGEVKTNITYNRNTVNVNIVSNSDFKLDLTLPTNNGSFLLFNGIDILDIIEENNKLKEENNKLKEENNKRKEKHRNTMREIRKKENPLNNMKIPKVKSNDNINNDNINNDNIKHYPNFKKDKRFIEDE